MGKLNTLKEIPHGNYIAECYSNMCCQSERDAEIRQEAIKWVREHQNPTNPQMNVVMDARERSCIISFIKHFFNLTETEVNGGK